MGDRRIDFVVYVKQTPYSHPLPVGGSYSVGRGASAHVRVDHPSVSREHLLLHTSPDGVEVEELKSSNGTVLFPAQTIAGLEADQPMLAGRRYPLVNGDMIRLGSVTAVLRCQEDRALPVLSTIPPSSFGTKSSRTGPAMRRVYELASRAAATDIGVLIVGETGTGKELLAAFVHEHSRRSAKQMLKLNCAALSESLIESELFGHEKGAFTGATNGRCGLLESTEGGTVFLDEIGEMPLSTQAKLLRVLEERRIRRLGSNKSIAIDVRFVAATNRDMEEEVAAGRFRGDLYYRISGIVLHLPALRNRLTEIEPLARHFLHEHCEKAEIPLPELTDEALAVLLRYRWPGNVRQLKNAMERAPILSDGGPIQPEHLPGFISPSQDAFVEEDFETTVVARHPVPELNARGPSSIARTPPSPKDPLPSLRAHAPSAFTDESRLNKLVHRNSHSYSEQDERGRIVTALEECSGNQTRAAKVLGVSRRTLINRLQELDVPRPRKGS